MVISLDHFSCFMSAGHRCLVPSLCQNFFPKSLNDRRSHILSANEHFFTHNYFGLDPGVLTLENDALVLLKESNPLFLRVLVHNRLLLRHVSDLLLNDLPAAFHSFQVLTMLLRC
jgi:hypothetical protein